jgi:hypothetical protein
MANPMGRMPWGWGRGVGLAGLITVGLCLGDALGRPVREPGGRADEATAALERTRAQARMLDHLFKVAVVDITNRYDGPPAIKVAQTIFAAAEDKDYFKAKLLDATGSPLNEANAPGDAFEKQAAQAMKQGQPYFEEVVGEGDSRTLRVATVVPAVVEKCAKCHGVKQGDLLGFLSYQLPVK